jgi:hypothetical protein
MADACCKCRTQQNYIDATDSSKAIIAEDCYRWLVHIRWSHVFVPPELLRRIAELNGEWAAAHPELAPLLQDDGLLDLDYPSASGGSDSSGRAAGAPKMDPPERMSSSSVEQLVRDPRQAGKWFVQGLMAQHGTMPAFLGAGAGSGRSGGKARSGAGWFGGAGRTGPVGVMRIGVPRRLF